MLQISEDFARRRTKTRATTTAHSASTASGAGHSPPLHSMCNTSCATHHVQHIMCNTSCATHHVQHIMCNTSCASKCLLPLSITLQSEVANLNTSICLCYLCALFTLSLGSSLLHRLHCAIRVDVRFILRCRRSHRNFAEC